MARAPQQLRSVFNGRTIFESKEHCHEPQVRSARNGVLIAGPALTWVRRVRR
jgi:hypothetical protein